MVIFISEMKGAMWTMEQGSKVDKFVEVAPVARPGHPRVCGRKKKQTKKSPSVYTRIIGLL
jgi:hypothetical protein